MRDDATMPSGGRTRRRTGIPALLLAGALAAGCGGEPELDTRTFTLEHLDASEASRLVDPYIYGDRPEAPGRTSTGAGAVTVRETPDNLDKIERVLAEYDVPSPLIRLHFQLIRADGASSPDPAIADVRSQLEKLFQFEGYELMGEAVISARERSVVGQELAGPEEEYGVRAEVGGFRRPGTIRLEQINLRGPGGAGFQTSVNVQGGQTVVLGTTRVPREGTALILTVRAELLDGNGT